MPAINLTLSLIGQYYFSDKESVSSSKKQTTKNSGVADPRSRWIGWFRITMAVLVAIAIVWTAVKATKQLSESSLGFTDIGYVWWICAIGVYIVAMFLSCLFWHRVLVALGQSPKFGQSLMAFYASQLGKYVPGKAMVVVIRTDLIRGDDVRTAPAAASVFVETLTWLFVGAAVASLMLVVWFRDQTFLQITAGILMVVAGVLTWPSIFRSIALKMGTVRGRNVAKMFEGLSLATMSYGWFVIAIGWCLNGSSLWLVLKGLPGTDVVASDYPFCLLYTSPSPRDRG